MLVVLLFITIPILLMIVIGILGIRDGLKNGFPKSSSDSDDGFDLKYTTKCTTTNPDGDISSPFSNYWKNGSMW